MAQQNPQSQYQALVTRAKTLATSVAFTGGWDHEPKLPPGGASSAPNNHVLEMRSRSRGHLCGYLSSGLANADVKPEEINAVFEFLEQSYELVPLLAAAVEQLETASAAQAATIAKLNAQLAECQKRLGQQP